MRYICILLCFAAVAVIAEPTNEKLTSLQGPLPIPTAAHEAPKAAPAPVSFEKSDEQQADDSFDDLMRGLLGAGGHHDRAEIPGVVPMGAEPFLDALESAGNDDGHAKDDMSQVAMPEMIMMSGPPPSSENPLEDLLSAAAGADEQPEDGDGEVMMFAPPRVSGDHAADLAEMLEQSEPRGRLPPFMRPPPPSFLRGSPEPFGPMGSVPEVVDEENPFQALFSGPGLVIGGGEVPNDGPLEVVEEVGPRPMSGAPIPIQALLDGLVGGSAGAFPLGPMDWTKNGDRLEFRVPLPTKKNLKVGVHNIGTEHYVTISEKEKADKTVTKKDQVADFNPLSGEEIEDHIELPYAVKASDVEAKFHKGVLIISIPFKGDNQKSVLSKVQKKVKGAHAPTATPLVKKPESAEVKPAAAPKKADDGKYKPVQIVPSLEEAPKHKEDVAVVPESAKVVHKITRTQSGVSVSK